MRRERVDSEFPNTDFDDGATPDRESMTASPVAPPARRWLEGVMHHGAARDWGAVVCNARPTWWNQRETLKGHVPVVVPVTDMLFEAKCPCASRASTLTVFVPVQFTVVSQVLALGPVATPLTRHV